MDDYILSEEELVDKYTPYIYKIAKKFYNVELADLYQAGAIGLIEAKRNFKLEFNVSFQVFAYKYIFGRMYELANKSRDIKLSKYYLSLYKQIQLARKELTFKLERTPSLEEIADFTSIDQGLINEIIVLTTNMLSLEEEYQTVHGDSLPLKECIGTAPNMDEQIMINDSLENLEPLEQDVIRIRYFEDLTQMETAKVLGISQVKVSRLEQKGKAKIKEYIAA